MLILGYLFIRYFNKALDDWKYQSNTLHYHLSEIQAFYDRVKSIKIKFNSNSASIISNENLVDWFFTIGQGEVKFFKMGKSVKSYKDFLSRVTQKSRSKSGRCIPKNYDRRKVGF